MALRVVLVGLGPIGAAVARQAASRRGLTIVGAVDLDPDKAGRDLGDVIALGKRLRLRVADDLDRTLRVAAPDVALLCTASTLRSAAPLFESVLKRRVPIVTTTEEAAYPAAYSRILAARLDAAARRARVAILGTGVNPGFAMDALPIALSAVCERVERIEVHRVQDARIRRLPFQRKIGAGLNVAEFQARVADGRVRHVGFAGSIRMIADAMGWKLQRVEDRVQPAMAEHRVASEFLTVEAGSVAGLVQVGIGYVGGDPKIVLRLEAYLGAPRSYDSVLIEGSPRIHSTIEGGIHGDIATASMVVNAIPAVLAAEPGFRTMRDIWLPSYRA